MSVAAGNIVNICLYPNRKQASVFWAYTTIHENNLGNRVFDNRIGRPRYIPAGVENQITHLRLILTINIDATPECWRWTRQQCVKMSDWYSYDWNKKQHRRTYLQTIPHACQWPNTHKNESWNRIVVMTSNWNNGPVPTNNWCYLVYHASTVVSFIRNWLKVL